MNNMKTTVDNQQNDNFTFIAIPVENFQVVGDQSEAVTVTQNLIFRTLPDGSLCLVDTAEQFVNESATIPAVTNTVVTPLEKEQNKESYPFKLSDLTGLLKPQVAKTIPNSTNKAEVRYLNCKNSQDNKKTEPPKTKSRTSKCNICGEILKMGKFKKHMEEHMNSKTYNCKHCSEGFNVEDNYKLHMALHSEGDPVCPACGRKFQRYASLKAHLVVHQVEETYNCVECLAEFEKEDEYLEHLESHKDELIPVNQSQNSTFVCSYCNYTFSDSAAYREHMTFHIKIRKMVLKKRSRRKNNGNKKHDHKCEICEKTFSKFCLLERHLRIHSGEKPFVCSYCQRGFAQKGSLIIHMSKHTGIKPFKCTLCPAKFGQKVNLRVHVEKTHSAPIPGEKLYKCTQCTCVFKKVASLNGHITRAHSGNRYPPKDDIANVMDQLKNLEKQTGHAKESPKELEYTERTLSDNVVHAPLNNVMSKADESFVKLADSSIDGTIRRYVIKQRKCGDVRYYMCSYCIKEFKKPSDLIRHLRTHTREKPFKCQMCDAAFSLKSTLDTHTNTHYGIKDFACTICEKFFTTLRALNAHYKRHDANIVATVAKPYKCTECDKVFTTVAKANIHMAIHEIGEVKVVQVNGQQSDKLQEPSVEEIPVVMKQPILETDNGSFRYIGPPKPRIPFADMDQYKNRPFKCHLCNAAFTKPIHVKRHMLMHTGEKRFTCEICSKGFYTSYALNDHLNFHRGIKKFQCKVCNKRFTTSTILKRHMFTHIPDRPYMCPYCKKRFKTVVLCRKHINIHKRDINMQLQALNETGEITGLEKSDAAKLLNLSETDTTIPSTISITENPEESKKCTELSANKPEELVSGVKPKRRYVRRKIINESGEISEADRQNLLAVAGAGLITTNETENQNQAVIPRGDPPPYEKVANITIASGIDPNQFINIDVGENNTQESSNNMQTIYINCEDVQGLDVSQLYNNVLPQLRLQSNDPLLLSSLNDFQDSSNILFPLDPNLPLTDAQNIDTFNSNIIFNSTVPINDLNTINFSVSNLAGKETTGDQITLPSISEIGSKNNKVISFLNPNEAPSTSKELEKAKSIITSNLSSSSNFPNTQFEVQVAPQLNENITVLSSSQINTTSSGGNQSKNAEIMCASCKMILNSMTDYQKHQCIFVDSEGVLPGALQETCYLNKELEESMGNVSEAKKPIQLQKTLPPPPPYVPPTSNVTEPSENPIEAPKGSELTVQSMVEDIRNMCQECGKKFPNKTTLLKHKKQHTRRNTSNENICSFCEKKFRKPSDLQRHIRTHTGEKPFSCEKCSKSFSLKSTLLSHLRTHIPGGNKEFNCNICNSFFSSKNSLRVHVRVHTGQKPHQCPMCPSKFRTLAHRKNHIKSHLKDTVKKAVSKKAKASSLLESLAMEAVNSIQQEANPQNTIDEEFFRTGDIASQVEIQDTGSSIENIHIDPLLFQQLQSSGILIQDSSGVEYPITFGIDADGVTQVINIPTPQEVPTTNVIETIEPRLGKEIEKIIAETNLDEEFECDYCSKKYKCKSSLRKHKKLHNSQFKCLKCVKGFSSQQTLDKHMKLHNSDGSKSFSCYLCANNFSGEGNLKTHLKRIHNVAV